MMAERLLATQLRTILAHSVFPEHLPEKAELPAIVYQRIGGRLNSTVCEDALTPRFQITIFAKEMEVREQLFKKVKKALAETAELASAPIFSWDYFQKCRVAVMDYYYCCDDEEEDGI